MGLSCAKRSGPKSAYVTEDEKFAVQQTWREALKGSGGLEGLVPKLFSQRPSTHMMMGAACNLIGFGHIQTKMTQQACDIGRFLNLLIVNMDLSEEDVTRACEQFGSQDAEREIKEPNVHCQIKAFGLFTSMFISFLCFQEKHDKDIILAWKRLSAFVLAAMRDGAYWTEEQWGVHLDTHL